MADKRVLAVFGVLLGIDVKGADDGMGEEYSPPPKEQPKKEEPKKEAKKEEVKVSFSLLNSFTLFTLFMS